MANIKISELDELSKASNEDMLVIVDTSENETKKIKVDNFGAGVNIPIQNQQPSSADDTQFYINSSDNTFNYYNDGKWNEVLNNQIKVQDTEPTDETTMVWIDTTEDGNGSISEVVNSLSGNETKKAPSVQAVNNKFKELTTYSTEEQIVGTYVDGRPIYRKVIISTNISNGSNLIDIPTNIAEIVDFDVLSHRDNNIIKNNQTIQEGYRQLVTPDLTNNKIEIYIEGISIQYSHITLEYTKTTDTAMSTVSKEA